MPAIGVGPSYCALRVANHVTRATFKTMFVVKQNAAVAHWYEEVGGATRYTLFGRTRSADFIVNFDVGSRANSELHR